MYRVIFLVLVVGGVSSSLGKISKRDADDEYYRPQFLCDDTVVYLPIGARDVEISCAVKGNPPVVDAGVIWYDPSDEISPDAPEVVVREGDNANEVVITLKIEEVKQQHFLAYTFKASNDKGQTTHDVTLMEVGSGKSRRKEMMSSSSVIHAPIVTILISFVVVAVWR